MMASAAIVDMVARSMQRSRTGSRTIQCLVVRSATMYCHVLVDCEYMLWIIGGVLRPDSGECESEEGVDADIMYGNLPEAAVSMLLDESDVASGKLSRHSRFQ